MSEQDKTDELLEQRGQIYGDAVTQYGQVAQMWSGLIDHEITAHQAALMMVALKLVRASTSPAHKDNLDDAAGYVRIAQRIAAVWADKVPSFDDLAATAEREAEAERRAAVRKENLAWAEKQGLISIDEDEPIPYVLGLLTESVCQCTSEERTRQHTLAQHYQVVHGVTL